MTLLRAFPCTHYTLIQPLMPLCQAFQARSAVPIYLVLPLLGVWGSASFSPEEKKKVALIKNYSTPIDRTTILELMLMIKEHMAFLAAGKINRHSVHWAGIWGQKAAQVYQRAELSIRGDAVAESAYHDIVYSWSKLKRSFRIKVGGALAAIFLLLVVVIAAGGPFKLMTLPFRGWSDTSSWFDLDKYSAPYEWPDTELSRLLPEPESDDGRIRHKGKDSLQVDIHDFSEEQFVTYIRLCKTKGFALNSVVEGDTYEAYNEEEYRLKLSYSSSSSTMKIVIDAPKGKLQWPKTAIGNVIPQPESQRGEIHWEYDEQLRLTVYGLSEEQFEAYVEECKERGFTIEEQTRSDYYAARASYEAYNEAGYYLKLMYYDIDDRGLVVECDAPMQMGTIRWPKTDVVKSVPKPKSDLGKIERETEKMFRVFIADTTPEQYADYIDSCIKKGFSKGGYTREETHFRGTNSSGAILTVDYIGFNTMEIEVQN